MRMTILQTRTPLASTFKQIECFKPIRFYEFSVAVTLYLIVAVVITKGHSTTSNLTTLAAIAFLKTLSTCSILV
jgi:hypothetical protein